MIFDDLVYCCQIGFRLAFKKWGLVGYWLNDTAFIASIEKNDRISNSLFRVVEMLNAWILIALESRA